MNIIKQFGLQRSGTNALKALVEINFKDIYVLSNYLGNKHDGTSWKTMEEFMLNQNPQEFYISEEMKDIIEKSVNDKHLYCIINIKDPVSWLNSYYKYQRKKVLFKNPEAKFELDLKFAQKSLHNWWAGNISSWLDFAIQNEAITVVVQHETILDNPINKLKEMEQKFQLNREDEEYKLYLEGYTKRATDKEHGQDILNSKITFDRSYHLHGVWKNDMPEEVFNYALEFMTEFFHINKQYMSFFDFSYFSQPLKI